MTEAGVGKEGGEGCTMPTPLPPYTSMRWVPTLTVRTQKASYKIMRRHDPHGPKSQSSEPAWQVRLQFGRDALRRLGRSSSCIVRMGPDNALTMRSQR
eukprot:354542-Chlamydomonas_euryale.AAC.8